MFKTLQWHPDIYRLAKKGMMLSGFKKIVLNLIWFLLNRH